MDQPILSLENVSKFYTSTANVVVGLNNINLSFRRGEFVAITGESGSGKSTLSNVLSGILPYESGELLFGGKPTSHFDSSDWERYRRDHISYISQSYGILPGATVLMNVVTALRLSGMDRRQAQENAAKILQQVELWELRHRRAAKLSSGQKQRLSIARALAKPASILIADEPTGNLDPENSAKVISLLHQAAESRLVLLVTHEFDEVRDHATRHIRLQDGKVVLDTALRPAKNPQPVEKAEPSHRSPMSLYIARLQLRSRPVWGGLMTLFFALTAFAVFAFLGAFIIALDDTDTRLYDSSAFLNGNPNRIVVSSQKLNPLTQQQLETLANLKYVTAVEPNGYVTDIQYAYRDSVDYTTVYTEVVEGTRDDPIRYTISSYTVHKDAPFLQTVPILPEGQQFLVEGAIPDGFYEVAAHISDGLKIGDTVDVFLTTQQYWGNNVYLKLEFTVTGITSHGSGLYFSERVGKFFQQVVHTSGNASYYHFIPEFPNWEERFGDAVEALPEGFSLELKDGQCRVHYSIFTSQSDKINVDTGALDLLVPDVNLTIQGKDPFLKENLVAISTPPTTYLDTPPNVSSAVPVKLQNQFHTTKWLTRLMEVNQNTFDKLTWQAASEQASITIEDYAYTDRVISALSEAGFVAVSPFQLGSAQVDEEKADQRMQTLSICLLALLAVVLLQLVLLRAMFSAQTESYQLLSNIGLVSGTAKLSVLWQFLCFTLLGQLLGGGAVFLCGQLGIERIVHILRYLPAPYILLLSAVHLAASLAATGWVIRALGKQVYPLAGRYTDLNLDDQEEEAAL